MGKVVIMAVGPVLKRELMPEIDRELSIMRASRNVALAADYTFEALLKMESIKTRSVATCLNECVTAGSIAQVLSDPDVLIGDKEIWWPSV